MIYLGCPYSHPDPAIVQKRFEYVTRVAGALMKRGYVVFSPITHSHPIAMLEKMPGTWEFWAEQDLHILALCDELHVLELPGWQQSVGLRAEINAAVHAGLRVKRWDPSDFDYPLSDLRACGL